MKKKYLTINEAAATIKVSEETIRRWLRQGNLTKIILEGDTSGNYYISEEEFLKYISQIPKYKREAMLGTGIASTAIAATLTNPIGTLAAMIGAGALLAIRELRKSSKISTEEFRVLALLAKAKNENDQNEIKKQIEQKETELDDLRNELITKKKEADEIERILTDEN